MSEQTVLVVGGGPAGMLAADTAARRGREVVLLEKNPFLGKKLNITGKGRCNLTNNCGPQEFLQNIPGDFRFLYSALRAFSPADTMEYFEQAGVPLKTERGNRVFPASDRARDVTDALVRRCREAGVRTVKAQAKELLLENGAVAGVRTDRGTFRSASVLLATGGLSYPGTGSTGDGYRLAQKCGHRVTPLRPSLVPLVAQEPFCRDMQGLSLRNVRLRVFDGENREIFQDFGELLFTHFGVSGPLVLSASAHMRNLGDTVYRLSLDLKPALDEKKLNLRILRDFEKYKNRAFGNALGDLLHRTMIPVIIELSGIPPETRVHSVSREQRRRLLELLKDFPLHVAHARPVEEAIVTAGGVDVKEISPKTMESKLVKGLYFAGEILDLDGYTGGFNLQIAWSTGFAAGNAM